MGPTAGVLNLTPNYLTILVLMVVRVSAMLLTTPVLGARTVPAMTKIGLALVLSFVLLPLAAPNAVVPETFAHLVFALGKEIAIGLLAGLAVTLIYASLQIVASLAGTQIGFGFSGTVDINASSQASVLDHLFTGVATLIFLTGNFHHQFLIGMQALFDIMPPNAFSFFSITPSGLINLSASMFLAALRIVLPLLGALLLTDMALGVLARTAPQMNVFFVGMPMKIGIGIFALIVMMPFVVRSIEILFGGLVNDMVLILR